jgi:hypothetical protein
MTERKRVYRDIDGVVRTMIWDDDDPNTVTIQTTQDVEPILELAAARRDGHDRRQGIQGEGILPIAIYERAVREQWDEADWRKFWNGEGRPFRTSPGWV